MNDLNELKTRILDDIRSGSDYAETEEKRIKYLSKKGEITLLFGKIKDIEPENRKDFGQFINDLRDEAFDIINSLKEKYCETSAEDIDLTLPGKMPESGSYHPLNLVRDELKKIFRKMGFSVAAGPEVETEYYIFDALNMPSWHPARKVTDSLYVEKDKLLRTETSSVQIRTMEKGKPPFRIISPGRVYRNEKENATHTAMFSQCEGLYVNRGVSFAELKGTLKEFFKALYGKDTVVRFRPHFFPFTEPSAEVDVSCFKCKGKGCSICKKSGWLELGGCGMVHPKVLENVGIDSEEFTGFAFGLGIERLAMLKYGVNDIRDFTENDLRFLEQF
ncbi:MAG: phenylalanine--tRNA ligase subunit alpha [Candidatus Delongbacteria bacterium]|jgi:phenylalanyl-tRNA synthetase alpha chain|nr:phenylalanine--tRNA ligase subunit alpha [Candidatus Delongbacteria bacterium]MDY0017969.1 phenylalanine--tRNA ligase subunit alpha [Candidatus Delongbacteria bacterium]